MSAQTRGQVIGRAGAGLAAGNNGWAANADVARVGRGGELATARVLNEMAFRMGGPTVLHDLTIPGSRANIDHVVVSGRRVTLVDTKVWKPGVYWRLGGRTFRGLARFPYADKDTMAMAVDRIAGHLRQLGVTADLRRPLTVVWPSRDGSVQMLTFSGPHGRRRLLSGPALERSTRRLGNRPADPNVVAALVPLVPSAKPLATARPAPAAFLW